MFEKYVTMIQRDFVLADDLFHFVTEHTVFLVYSLSHICHLTVNKIYISLHNRMCIEEQIVEVT